MKKSLGILTTLILFFMHLFSANAQDTLKLAGGEEKIVYITAFDAKTVSFYEAGDDKKQIYTMPIDMFVMISKATPESPSYQKEKIEPPQRKVRNAIYVELLGPGGFASLNYDIRVRLDDHFGLGGRIGAGATLFFIASSTSSILELNASYKHNNSYFVMGLGQVRTESSAIFSETTSHQGLLVDFSYRYMAPKVGFFFQASINPVLYSDNDFSSIPFGISFGLAF